MKSTSALTALTFLGHHGYDLVRSFDNMKVGVIGTGWYGKSDVFRLIQVAEVEVVAIADVDDQMADHAATLIGERQKNKKKPRIYRNYLEMLEQHSFDLILIGTPDHWHALNAIAAIQSGAHVYLQKPVSTDVLEGEAILSQARKHNRKVQVGTQRRSTPHLIQAKTDIIEKGLLGKIAHIEIFNYYHMRFNGNPPAMEIPSHFDYDLWCGPAPMRTFDGLPHRRWRAYMEYSNGIMGDMCVHMLDTVRWLVGLGWPSRISSSGGIYVQKESNANISDTQTAIFEYPDLNVLWQHRTWGKSADPDYPWGFKIYGENGVLKGDVHKYEFVGKDNKVIRGDAVLEKELFPEDVYEKGIEIHAAPATRGHMLDLLSCIESGSKPVADIEEGLISSAACILANVSMEIGRPLKYDHQNRTIMDDADASKLLQRAYRKGYDHPEKYL